MPRTEQQEAKPATADAESEDLLTIAGMRTPARGASGSTLETVQEISLPNTPGPGLDGVLEKNSIGKLGEDNVMDNAFNKSLGSKGATGSNESGSESGGRSEKLRSVSLAPPSTTRPGAPAVKAYSTSTATGVGRGKSLAEGIARNMTVETETVSSVPQVAVGGVGTGNGSIRTKPSSETIRPKKEKKKTTRKAPSVNAGTGEQLPFTKPRLHHYYPTKRVDDSPFDYSELSYSQGLDGSRLAHSISPIEYPSIPASRRTTSGSRSVSQLLTRVRPASSKADFFEATVASAVDEANSSDSEETFVYESNPPENTDRPRRFHSRTPSVTSMASQADQRTGGRALADPGHSVAMKKSMKFANTYNSSTTDATTKEDDGRGTARSSAGTGRGTTHHHHIGRWGRHGGNGHASLFDNESPFPNAAKSKLSGTHNPPKQTSQPSSPRMASKTTPYGKRSSPISSGYDMDDGADDERTPLVSTIRSGRSGRNRRPGSSLRQLEHQAARQNRSFLARFAGCIVISLMIVMVFTGAIGFMFATTQPLSEVSVIAIKNVLASEQEIIFDLKVSARNPNLVAVTVDTSDIFVFAKSKYAGTDSEWWSHPPEGTLRRSQDDVDDPEDGSPTPSPNFDIGEVYALQSPLIFEGSPFHHFHSVSTGQIRISHPGNTTIPSGSERWGRVVEHEFDLIIRGTLIYTLPLTQKIRTVIVEGRITVKPNASEQDPDRLPKPISDGAGGEIGVTA